MESRLSNRRRIQIRKPTPYVPFHDARRAVVDGGGGDGVGVVGHLASVSAA